MTGKRFIFYLIITLCCGIGIYHAKNIIGSELPSNYAVMVPVGSSGVSNYNFKITNPAEIKEIKSRIDKIQKDHILAKKPLHPSSIICYSGILIANGKEITSPGMHYYVYRNVVEIAKMEGDFATNPIYKPKYKILLKDTANIEGYVAKLYINSVNKSKDHSQRAQEAVTNYFKIHNLLSNDGTYLVPKGDPWFTEENKKGPIFNFSINYDDRAEEGIYEQKIISRKELDPYLEVLFTDIKDGKVTDFKKIPPMFYLGISDYFSMYNMEFGYAKFKINRDRVESDLSYFDLQLTTFLKMMKGKKTHEVIDFFGKPMDIYIEKNDRLVLEYAGNKTYICTFSKDGTLEAIKTRKLRTKPKGYE